MKRLWTILGLAFSLSGLAQTKIDGASQIISDPSFESNSDVTVGAICDITKPGSCRAVSGIDIFETFSQTIMAASTANGRPNSGSRYVRLGGHGVRQIDFLIQQLTVPAQANNAVLRFYLNVATRERSSNKKDTLTVQVRTEHDVLLEKLKIYSNKDANQGYKDEEFDLSQYAGQTIRIAFTSVEDASQPTWFWLDDLTLTISP